MTDISTIWEKLFNDLHNYWLDQTAKISISTTEESQEELSLPSDVQTRLCFFDIPNSLISIYKTNIFPLFTDYDYRPITIADMIFPADTILATIASLIERSRLIVIDIPITRQDYTHGLQLALEKKKSIILISEEDSIIPSYYLNSNQIQIVRRPTNIDPEIIRNKLEICLKRVSNLLSEESSEPDNLINNNYYNAAVISALNLLETTIKERLQRINPYREESRISSFVQLMESAVTFDVITPEMSKKASEWYQIRSKLVHGKEEIDKNVAMKIVQEINEYVKESRELHRNTMYCSKIK
jgi:uncharacterized protein YutE (UPF0331/DUF86 family)